MAEQVEQFVPFHAVTPPQANHFFGYYEKCPWSENGRYLLALESTFQDRVPTETDVALVGIVDLANDNRWRVLGQTRAWNFRQGSMLQWLPGDANRKIVCNDRRDADAFGNPRRFVSVIFDAFSGESKELPLPVYAVHPSGEQAVSLNFARLAHARPVFGYEGVPDPGREVAAPDNDGIYRMDMETGEHELVFTLAEAAATRPNPSMNGAKHWFNHLAYSPSGNRIAFMHRWRRPGEHWSTQLFVMNSDGSDARIIANEKMVSHFDWQDDDTIFGWFCLKGRDGHWRLNVESCDGTILEPDMLLPDGHCSFHPESRSRGDVRWMVADTYSKDRTQFGVALYDTESDLRIDIGRFDAPSRYRGPIKCDLSSRWSRDGHSVCIDSVHEGKRQVYVADVRDIVEG